MGQRKGGEIKESRMPGVDGNNAAGLAAAGSYLINWKRGCVIKI
jgi:hypothetical protein